MKCQCKEYCDGNKAEHKCKDCGKYYCDECASCEGYTCDCIDPTDNIEPIDSQFTGSGNK